MFMVMAGVTLLVTGLHFGALTKSHRKGFWFAFPGTILVVMGIFFLAGFNGTAYYPSVTHLQSSLSIRNSCSSYFTLQVMFWVSLIIPFVVAYIAYAWYKMDRHGITDREIEKTAISLEEVLGTVPKDAGSVPTEKGSVPVVREAVLGEIGRLYEVWCEKGFGAIWPEIAKIDCLRGQALAVRQTDDDAAPVVGVSGGIQPDGSLDVGGVRVYAGEAHVERAFCN